MKPDPRSRLPVDAPVAVDRARFISHSKSLSILLSLVLATVASAEAILWIQSPEEISVEEGFGEIVITIARGGDLTGAVSVAYRTVIGTATAPADFTTAAGVARFETGVVNVSVRIPIIADTRVEGLETFRFILLRPSPGAVLGTPDDVRITIVDDAAGLHFVQSHYVVAEDGGEVQLTVSRGQGLGSACRVDFATQADTASAGTDFESTTGTLVFAAGERAQAIRVPILNDGRLEGPESFRVQLSNPSVGTELGTPATAQVTIEDNDIGVGFSAVEATFPESEMALMVEVVRGGDDIAAFTVDYATADGTARAGQDYVGAASTLAFGEGENSKTLTIQFLDDGMREGPEQFTVRLSNPSGDRGLGEATFTIWIQDNDRGISFSEAEVWANEANPTVSVRVLRGSDDTAPFTVDYRTRLGTATEEDFIQNGGTLEFAGGETIQLIVIELINDGLSEAAEQFSVELFNPSDGRFLERSAVVINLEDNDPGVGFAGNEMWVQENQSVAVLTVRRGSDLPGAFTVQYATRDGIARAGSDYVAASGTLEFGEGEEIRTIEIELLNEALAENEEPFSVRLSNPSVGRLLDAQNTVVTVRIGDNDLGVGFVPGWVSAREDAGIVELRVERQTDYTGPFQVAFGTRAPDPGVSGATIGMDFIGTSGVLEFGEGENFKTIQVEILNDAAREEHEEFPVRLSDVTGAGIGIFEAQANVVIEDNDPGLHFDPVEVRVSEGEPEALVRVHRGSDSLEPFSVDYATREVSSCGLAVFQPASGTLAFGDGETTRTLTLLLQGDDGVWQGDQEFEVVLSRPTGVGVIDPNRSIGRVVVIDDEAPLRWEAHWVGEPFPEVWGLQAVTWGGGRYVAVGGEWAVVSEDGRTWTARRVNLMQVWDLIWVGGEYVAVGDTGVWRSADGLDWASVASTPRNLFRVSHGSGVYVALDREGGAWMSWDLAEWRSEKLGPNLRDLTHGHGGFVVVGDEGKAWHWQPGRSWEALGRIAPGWLGAVTWGNVGYVTASSQYDEQTQSEYLLVLESWDGRTWWTNRVDEPMSTPDYLVYGDGAYVGVSWNRVLRLRWEADQWKAESSLGTPSYWFGMGDLAYGGAGYVAPSSSAVALSADGLTWERLHRPDLADIHAAGDRLLVAHVTGDRFHWSYFEIHSAVGAVDWTVERSGGFGGGTGSGLVSLDGVVGDLRGGVLYLRSEEGAWRSVSFAEQGWVRDVAAGSGLWVVVGRQYDEAAGRDQIVVYRSRDGESWETQKLRFEGELNRVFHAGDRFYAGGNENNVGEVVLQSVDGVAWQRIPTLSGQFEIYAMAYGKGTYLAAARGHSDDQRVLLRSLDGVNWTVTKRFDLVDVWSADIEYGSGLFALTWRGWQGWGVLEGVVTYLSSDGVDWRRHTSLLGSITALDYADGRFVVAGPGGLVLRSQPLVYLGAPCVDGAGQIVVRLEGEAGRSYTVEGSADLVHWTMVGTVVPTSSEQEVVLPAGTSEAAYQFYRLTAGE